VHGAHLQAAVLRVADGDQPVQQAEVFVQHGEDLGQQFLDGPAAVKDAGDLRQRLQLGIQQFVAGWRAGAFGECGVHASFPCQLAEKGSSTTILQPWS